WRWPTPIWPSTTPSPLHRHLIDERNAMCAIAGIYDLLRHPDIDASLLLAMTDSQTHRGPDQGGTHLEAGIGLGHRRLSIIDLGGGQQPLFNEDHSVVVVYNGEIYNFQAL